ncbi:cellulase [Streptomyces sp. NPDC002580]|uniref:cellulase n=1 Tax=Streptomyces sp. NPDC002580 TaxID=3364653 RepID=UPI00368465AA
MDRFEQELTRMMRDSREVTPYETRHRDRLHAGVRARRRARTAWKATGSALTVAGLGVGLMVLAGSLARGGPTGPQPRPVTSAESVPMPSTARSASAAHGVPMPYRPSTPGPVLPQRTSITQVAPRSGPTGSGQ